MTTATATTGFYKSSTAHSSLCDTWTTPRAFFADLDRQHHFTLDAAALAVSTLVPDNWYGPNHPVAGRRDALKRNWAADANGGSVWLNPPYGRGIAPWMNKAVATARAGVKVVCLVPARTDTKWFQDTALAEFKAGRATIHFVRGRLKFGAGQNPAPFPSAVVIFNP